MKIMSKKRYTILALVAGIIGCIMMATGDYLMIYGDTSYLGKIAWLTKGVAEIPFARNNIAMILAFFAIIFYAIALFSIKKFITADKDAKVYSALTAVGLTPWLCLHLFYTMILYMFAFMSQNGKGEDGLILGEAIVNHFNWIIPVAEVIMLLPFVFWFYITVAKKTRFSPWMAINNPLIIYIVLKLFTMVLPDTPLRLAFTNGLMSESMLIWFVVYIITFCVKNKAQETIQDN